LKVRVLGCGTSTGVPKIGNEWGQCDPTEPRNARLRSSILVESGDTRILIDCGPDLRQQLLAAEVGRIDAVIATHDHGDHVHGIDELRPLAQALGAPMPVYSDEKTLASLRQRFAYAFASSEFYRPIVDGRLLPREERFGHARVRSVEQPHGTTVSLGLRFDEGGRSLVYAIDFNALTNDMAQLYQGADVLIGDCLTRNPHPTHMHLDGLLGIAKDLGIGQLYLTHMGNGLDYRTLAAELPDWAAPAHDGLEIML
jgi:phosphoribosyl 1,2-cyclic phosphate phosphodiesterase